MAQLNEPIDLFKLTQEGIDFQVSADHVRDQDNRSESEQEDDDLSLEEERKMLDNLNMQCVGIFDEDVYEEGQPFETIGKKMFDLVPDGKIKKRIIREGSGETPSEYATVKVHYNGYVEYGDEPFDSTYLRKKPWSFVLNDGKVIAGLDFSVQTMKLGEKAQFLIHPDYAYGKVTTGRIPGNSTVLFEVELLEIINSGAAVTYERLSEDQQKLFPEIYKFCIALCERGKKSFINSDYKKAVKDYNTGVCKLEKATLIGLEEVKKHRELALRIHTNLLISYTRMGESKKGCLHAQKIYELTENGELMKIVAKVYYNHAKCLRMLGEYADAKTILDKAYKLEPKNPEIANEMLNLENEKTVHRKKQEAFAKAALVGKIHE